jgi:hypothetical protein
MNANEFRRRTRHQLAGQLMRLRQRWNETEMAGPLRRLVQNIQGDRLELSCAGCARQMTHARLLCDNCARLYAIRSVRDVNALCDCQHRPLAEIYFRYRERGRERSLCSLHCVARHHEARFGRPGAWEDEPRH